jgi:GNAT superfamily N-acetyltransferase
VSVRRATAVDSAAAAAVVQTVYAELDLTWDAGGYHADLKDVQASYPAFFVAELDGTIVGTAALSDHGSLERLYVLPSARGHGLGAELVRAVVEEARVRGFARLEIWTDKLLADAHRLYERLGAYRDGERVNDDPDASHEWRYVLAVSGAGVAVFDEDDRVLVVRANYGRRRYLFPGGAIEAGETPARGRRSRGP